MKEATGELSTTVITIVAIAAISAIFVALILPMIRNQMLLSQACSNGPSYKGDAKGGSQGDYTIECGTSQTKVIGSRSWTCSLKNGNNTIGTKSCSD